jgi:hypothetical protein
LNIKTTQLKHHFVLSKVVFALKRYKKTTQ